MVSSASGASDGLTKREVFKMKKMLHEKDRLERACNIVLKGVNDQIGAIEKNKNEEGQNNYKEWAEKFLAMKLGIKTIIVSTRASGGRERVIIAKLENEEEKRRVMMNKSKLKGTKIYIENDLSFEERRKQEEIKKWAFERKTKGLKVKIGIGRVCVEEQWIK